MAPTDIQSQIILHEGNTVVLASPGSGKTFVMSEKIRNVLNKDAVLPYQGVIAISYTRKASANLKRRTLSGGISSKNSFFGTIDNFCLTQIVFPYGKYLWGHPDKELEVVGLGDIGKSQKAKFEWINSEHPDYENISTTRIEDLSILFKQGYVLIESLELLALHIIQHCIACQKFLKARFKYVFIDEYQDADTYIHQMFCELVDMGIVGVAVGDANQSIFGFAHKNSKYLKALKEMPQFKSFALQKNFRCSLPIINYSNRLLDSDCDIYDTDDTGVFLVRVDGAEDSISNFIDKKIALIRRSFNVPYNNEVAILVKNIRTQQIIDESLNVKHRLVETTELDKDLNTRSLLYAHLLKFFFDKRMAFISVIEEHVDYEALSICDRKRLNECKEIIRSVEEKDVDELPRYFKRIADILLPHIGDGESLKKLCLVINDDKSLYSYKPVDEDEVQLMTLHKSKGLEFDVVFHLNMSEWEMPTKHVINNDFDNPIYFNWEQDLNLHYVGITRARKACFLIRGTRRTNNNGEIKTAKDSEFLSLNGLEAFRKEATYC